MISIPAEAAIDLLLAERETAALGGRDSRSIVPAAPPAGYKQKPLVGTDEAVRRRRVPADDQIMWPSSH